MCIIIGSSERDCVLIILFQLYDNKGRLFEGNLFWVSQHDSSNIHIGRRTTPVLIQSNTILNIILQILTSLVPFVASKGKKIPPKINKNS